MTSLSKNPIPADKPNLFNSSHHNPVLFWTAVLLGSNTSSPRAEHKQHIRRVFHPQLKRLWEMNHHLLEFWESMTITTVKVGRHGDVDPTRVEDFAAKFGCED